MHLVIVAGGLGSRLAPITNNIPKFLVNIGKETGFVEQIRYWSEYRPDSITVIVHSAYAELVQAYYDLYFSKVVSKTEWDTGKPVPFIVKTVDVANGSAHAIFSTCDHLDKQPVLFTWCDVLPGEYFDAKQLNGAVVAAFTNYDHPNRYGLVKVPSGEFTVKQPALCADERGGIFGIYFVSTYSVKPFEDGQDFVEMLTQYSSVGTVKEIEIGSIIDWGDMPKLQSTRATADSARSFNSVTMHGNLVLKSALNDQGATLIKREIAWYDELQRLNSEVARPLFWPARDSRSFVMSKVNGVPIWTLWPSLDEGGRRLVLGRIFEQLDLLHSTKKEVGLTRVLADVTMEAYTKLVNRYQEIEHVIKAFGEVKTVSGWELKEPDPLKTISWVHEQLMLEYSKTTEYSLIHGDLQMSNSMINPDTLEVTLIDPRGYFGKSDTYGLADYDIAKLYYSTSGYDLFNYSTNFHIRTLKDGYLDFSIPRPTMNGCEAILDARFTRCHELWLAVVWIGLAQYIKNDPVKSLCAHYYGLQLAERIKDSRFWMINRE